MKKVRSLLFVCALICLLAACGKSSTAAWQEQYDLGMQYLTEGDYSAAIVAFTAAIEIEPKRATLYIARGDAYVAWAEETSDIALAIVAEGELVAWEEISTEDGSHTLQELYDNAQSDYEEAVGLLENGEAEDQSDDLLEEARQKLEEAKTKQEDGKDELARELIELAERILEGDPTEEEKELAEECLEAASELTDDEELVKRIEELQDLINGDDDSTQADENSVVQEEASEEVEEEADSTPIGYKAIEECSEEEQTTIISLVEVAQSGDLDSLPQLTEIPEVSGKFYYDGYKVQITRGYDYGETYDGREGYWWPYMIVSVRPKNGDGYCFYIREDLDPDNMQDGSFGTNKITDYVTCSCSYWNWDGEYTQTYIEDSWATTTIASETGTVERNVKEGTATVTYKFTYIYDTDAASDETRTVVYEGGYCIEGNNLSLIYTTDRTINGNYWQIEAARSSKLIYS